MSDRNKDQVDGAFHSHLTTIERIDSMMSQHRALLEVHSQILQDHANILKEIRGHVYKLDDIAINTGKLAYSVDSALGRVFTMLEKREDGSRKSAIVLATTLGLLLIIMSLAITKFELSAGSKDGHNITIREHNNGTENKVANP